MNSISLGPIIFGFIFGFIIGSQIKYNSKSTEKFTIASFAVIIIAAVVIAWQIGQFPFYDDIPINTAFLFAIIGLIFGKLVLGRKK